MLVLALFVMDRIVHSLLGRAFVAIRNGEALAESLGVPLMRTKVTAFVISVTYAGYAGALYAGFVRFLGPAIASEDNAFDMIAFILVGGLGTLSGPVLGAILLTWATQSLQFLQDYRLLDLRAAPDPPRHVPAEGVDRHDQGPTGARGGCAGGGGEGERGIPAPRFHPCGRRRDTRQRARMRDHGTHPSSVEASRRHRLPEVEKGSLVGNSARETSHA